MKLAVSSTYVPFIQGGGTTIVGSLVDQLTRRGHKAEAILFPLRSYWRDLPEQTLALRCFDLSEASGERIDRLITIRYPSFALRHPNKIAWFIHHHRGAYDLWGTEYQDIPNNLEGSRFRENLIRSDTMYLSECRKIYTNSRIVAKRLREFNHIEPDGILYPPLPNPELFYSGDYGDYFIYSSRLVPIKRQVLAIEAMRYVKSDFRLVLVGKADTDAYWKEIQSLLRRHRLEGKVELTGWISEQDKARLTANAFAALYIAFNEDSYGYSTLEAFHSSRAVITCRDSGGTNELIKDGINGLVAEPTPESLAESMERIWANRNQAVRMGKNAKMTLHHHNINWDHVVEVLTQ